MFDTCRGNISSMSARICKVEWCERKSHARGWCQACYVWSKQNRWADPASRKPLDRTGYPSKGTCRAEGCDGSGRLARGWCLACYGWSRENGWSDPSGRRRNTPDAMAARRAIIEEAASTTALTCFIAPGYDGVWSYALDGTVMRAARAVWTLAHGDPGDLMVLHKCNGGSGSNGCININHLYLGDHSRNMLDRGEVLVCAVEDNPNAKLTNSQVLEILSRHRSGETGAALAAEFNVSPTTVCDLLRGRSWNRLPGRDLA